jgi:hypothetical protein
MAIDRRTLLLALGSTAALAAWPARAAMPAARYLGCRLKGEESGGAAAFDLSGRELFAVDLPARGHDIALRPGSADAVIFARRPGTWFVVVDSGSGAVLQRQTAVADRHYFGHGVYSADGKLLYVTENDIRTGQGIIGTYDAASGYARLGEFPSHGIGPHDIALLPDGRTLVVANGGLMTLPDTGREVLNPDSMRSTIDLMDHDRGQLLARFELEPSYRNLSLRHLALTSRGDILFGGQYQGETDNLPLLAGLITAGGAMIMLPAPDEELVALENYIGSVAVDCSGEILAATSPHGNRIAFWNIGSGEFIGSRRMADVCGVAASPDAGEFVASSGNEGCAEMRVNIHDSASRLKSAAIPAGALRVWDNHLVLLD